MPAVRDILRKKGSLIHYISGATSVLDATRVMNDRQIGALIVSEDGGRPGGIFTERDVLRRVVAERRDPARTRVTDVCTRDLICCPPELDIDDASRIMTDKRVRHLPVCDENGQLLGLISIGDLNAWHASAQESTIHFLNDYIYGRV